MEIGIKGGEKGKMRMQSRTIPVVTLFADLTNCCVVAATAFAADIFTVSKKKGLIR